MGAHLAHKQKGTSNVLGALGIYTLIVAILFVAAIVDMRSYIAQLVDWKFDQSSEGKLAKVNAERKLKGEPPKQYFYTRLLLMNSVIHFLANVLKLRWFGGVKLILPIIFYGCASVVWPVAGIASIFHLRNEANKQRRNPDSQPWFATERSMPAMPKD